MSPGFAGGTALVVAWCLAVLGPAEIAGLPAGEVATALALAGIALALTGWAVERGRGSWRATAGAVAVWAILVAGVGGAWTKRGDLYETGRLIGEDLGIGMPRAEIGSGGEVAVTRRIDGTFAVPARVNDREVSFLFDTGATAVVLSAETAAALGFPTETLRFRIPVATANGRGTAAPVVLDRVAIGTIVMTRVPALVARPGMLEGNLLGHTFLDRLESYEVRGNRLVLRASKA